MEETGYIIRSPGNLNPTAEEFIPTNPIHFPPATVFTVPIPVGVFYATPHLSYSTLQQPLPPPPNLATSSTRSLLISSLASNVFITESLLRRELEVFGDVRGVQMENLLINGTVTVHFYDLRHAETALTEIQGQHMMQQARLRNYYYYGNGSFNAAPPVPPAARGVVGGRAVWAQFVVAACDDVIDGQNQGTIVVLNLDCGVSMKNVRQVFEPFGPIKELRETPSKKNQRFVEFFDIRDAAKALKEMNGKEIYGKVVVIEFSRVGSYSRKYFHSNKPLNFHNNVPPHPSPSHFSPPTPPQSHRKFSTPFVSNATNTNPHSHLPQLQLPFKKPSSVYKRSSKKIANSAGSIEEAIGSANLSEEIGNVVEKQQDQYSNGSSRRDETIIANTKHQPEVNRDNRHWKGKQGKNQDSRFLIKEDAIVESDTRDTRTTVMIKNIPNKYSQKLLLNMLDNHCIQCNEQIGDDNDQPYSSYDFVYLPIDFNNKCNVGYGFVNMTSPEATLRLYKAFNHQHWEVFNSRKICQITYARVQGLEALKEHFKNSKFPCEVDHYMPVLFSPPRDGKNELTEPLPLVGNNNHHFHQTIPIPQILQEHCNEDSEC